MVDGQRDQLFFLNFESLPLFAFLELFLRKLLSFEGSNQDIGKVDAFEFVELVWHKWLVGLIIVFGELQHTDDHSGGKGCCLDEL